MSACIENIEAFQIEDSRKRPALRVVVRAGGGEGSFDVPSGASTGSREARELRDPDGGLTKAMRCITEEIAPALFGRDAEKQRLIDETLLALDGTPLKERMGGNSLIGVSVAVARAAASARGVPLSTHLRELADIPRSRHAPHLFVNLINGGKHAEGGSSIQEHQIVTLDEDPRVAFATAERVERALHELLTEEGRPFTMGDEGGVVFPVTDASTAFEVLFRAVQKAGAEKEVVLGSDMAASSFFGNGTYTLCGSSYDTAQLSEQYHQLIQRYPLTFIEDPFDENDVPAFAAFQAAHPGVVVIGDDLTTTTASAITEAGTKGAIQAVIIKPNQVGTLSETLAAMQAARVEGVHCIMSHRSGETMDAFIADMAYAYGTLGLKAGAPSARERAVKYQRLIELYGNH